MIKKLIVFSFVLLSIKRSCDAERVDQKLEQNRRGFAKFIDEDKLKSYLSSFGANPTSAQTKSHEVFKRSSTMRKMKKSKKVLTTTETSDIEAPKIPTRPLKERNNLKNFTVSPRHIVHFELGDAKFNEEYEMLKKSRKLRFKRSSDLPTKTNETRRTEKFITKDTFVQPKEFFKFSLSDAVIKSSSEVGEMKESEKKSKREISNDSTATDTKKIHVTHPMRGHGATKHVSYDNISSKLQKMIDSALNDAVAKGKASEGDYLKFFYGDKIIKVPVSMAKYIALKKEKEKETANLKLESQSYPKENQSYPKENQSYPKEVQSFPKETQAIYGQKLVSVPSEELKVEAPKLLATKNAYYSINASPIKYDSKPKFLPTPSTLSENAESYVNFGSSPIVVQSDLKNESYKKSVYFYSNENNAYYPKNSLSSPGPVVFEDSITTPVSVESPKTYNFKNYVYHPKQVSLFKQETPITENVDESFDYIPSLPEKTYSTIPLPPPTSYIEYNGNHHSSHDVSKNYEFGYHVSDYKTGNNYGHSQKSTKDETKGQYSILLPDGRVQMVKYFADDSGFHADVSYQNVH